MLLRRLRRRCYLRLNAPAPRRRARRRCSLRAPLRHFFNALLMRRRLIGEAREYR